MLQICDNIQDPSSELQPEKAEGMAVKLKISFKDTKAGAALEDDVREIEAEKKHNAFSKSSTSGHIATSSRGNTGYLNRRLASAMKSKSSGDFHMTHRPYSAKTDFNNFDSRNPSTRGNFSNRMMSSQHMLNKAPSMKFLAQRPQTAAGAKTLRASSSVGKMQKFINPYTGGAMTATSMSRNIGKNKKSKKGRPKVQDLIFEGTVSTEGIVVFENIPKAICYVESSENEFFKNAFKVITLPTEADKDGKIEVYLPVERQDIYTTTIYMLRSQKNEEEKASQEDAPQEGSQDQDEHDSNNYHENLSLRAILLELFEKNNSEEGSQESEDSDLDSEVEYEEEFEQIEDAKGLPCYQCKLVPGRYMIVAKGREIKEFSEIIIIEEQITKLDFTPQQEYKKEISIQAFNAETGEDLSNVLLRLRKTNSKISSEGLTRTQGDYVYTIEANSTHYLEAERKGFIPYFLEINQTKGNEGNPIVKVPMVPIEKVKKLIIADPETKEEAEIRPNLFRVVLISDEESSMNSLALSLHFTVTNPENNEEEEISISEQNPSFESDTLNFEYKNHGNYGMLASFQAIGQEHANKWVRVTAEFGSDGLTDSSAFQFDHNFKNTLQDHNVKALIFNEKKLVSVVYSPNFITDMAYWDIGFINPAKNKFIKVNAAQKMPITAKSYTRFYMRFYKHLNEQGSSFNIKSKLGFEEESAILKGDDNVITNDKDFIGAIQSLDINWISDNLLEGADERSEGMNNIKDDKLKTREAELNEFYHILANGFRNIFGEISFKTTQSLLEPHLGISLASPQKMSRIINKSSRKIYF